MTYQILYLVLALISLLISANQHGKEKTKKENFWVSFISALIMILILTKGGFFDVILNKF